MNGYALQNFNRKNMLYIDGHPRTHGNIAGFINSTRSSLFSANFCFEEHSNDKEFFIKTSKHPDLLLCMPYVICLLVTSC